MYHQDPEDPSESAGHMSGLYAWWTLVVVACCFAHCQLPVNEMRDLCVNDVNRDRLC